MLADQLNPCLIAFRVCRLADDALADGFVDGGIVGLRIGEFELLESDGHEFVEGPLHTTLHRLGEEGGEVLVLGFGGHETAQGIARLFHVVGDEGGAMLFVEAVVEALAQLLLAGVGLADLEGLRLLDHLALEHLEGLVGQFGADRSTHVAVGLTLVEVKHTDDAAIQVLGQCHQLFHDERGLYGVVDVGHEVLDAVDDCQVGFDASDGHLDHPPTGFIAEASEVEGIEVVVESRRCLLVLGIVAADEGNDTFLLELLGRLLTLFGVNPNDLEGYFACPCQ